MYLHVAIWMSWGIDFFFFFFVYLFSVSYFLKHFLSSHPHWSINYYVYDNFTAFRFTSVFPPEPHPLAKEKVDVARLQNFTPFCIQTREVMVQVWYHIDKFFRIWFCSVTDGVFISFYFYFLLLSSWKAQGIGQWMMYLLKRLSLLSYLKLRRGIHSGFFFGICSI